MLANWDAFSELSRMQDDLGRWFGNTNQRQGFRPAVDIHEDEDAYSVQLDVPGVSLENIDIELEKGILTVKGERRFERAVDGKKEDKNGYHYVERNYGAFMRRFTVPDAIKEDGIDAKLKDGVLTLRLPKAPQAKSRKIAVSA